MQFDCLLSDNFLSVAGAWITYSVQVALAYLIARAICALILRPRMRLRVWGGFLFLAAAGWLYVCACALRGTPAYTSSTVPLLGGYMHRSWPVERSWAAHLGLAAWVWPVYLFVVMVSLFDLLLKSARLRKLLRTSRPPGHELEVLFREICCEMKLTHCRLLLVPELRSPATCGLWRARVLMPAGLIPQLSAAQLADIMRHELTHVSQRDYLWDRLAGLACRAAFFHPTVWLGRRRFRWERELACDQTVVESGGGARLHYAECLTRLARWSYQADITSPDGIGFSSSSSRLTMRVGTLLRGPQSYSPFRQAAHTALIALLASSGAFGLAHLSLTFHWAMNPTSAGARFRAAHFTAPRKKAFRKSLAAVSQRSETREPPLLPKAANFKPGELFPAFSPALPILSPEETGDVEMQSENDGSISVALHPVWDESPVPWGTTFPTWKKLAIDAVIGGLGAAIPGEDSDARVPRPRARPSHPR